LNDFAFDVIDGAKFITFGINPLNLAIGIVVNVFGTVVFGIDESS
jgi:hypothetical protein